VKATKLHNSPLYQNSLAFILTRCFSNRGMRTTNGAPTIDQAGITRGCFIHATRQVQSPAGEWAASKLASPIARRNANAGQSATSSFDTSELNWRTAFFNHQLLTSRISYNERVYKRETTPASE